jgi:hypothetical protein
MTKSRKKITYNNIKEATMEELLRMEDDLCEEMINFLNGKLVLQLSLLLEVNRELTRREK